MQYIFLWGMMGVGKTSIGKKLATKLGWNYLDSDEEIERSAGKTISEIFQESGEKRFRDAENEWIKTLDSPQSVISLGGGTPCFNDLDEVLLRRGLCIWLDASIGMIANRLENSKKERPLIQDLHHDELIARLENMLSERSSHYQKAHLIAQVPKTSVDELLVYIRMITEGK